jgi:ATP-dependent RNA helicase RhlE
MFQNSIPQGFRALALSSKLHDTLDHLRFVEPTPIQAKAIPHALEGRDLIGIAQTGTGKTLAFGLPIIHRLREQSGPALVLVPTRELALQVEDVFRKVGGRLGVKTAVLIGGAPMNKQIGQLRAHPQVIVATPGRLEDHMQQGTVDLRHVSVVVLDEADRMLDMGFAPAIRRILDVTPRDRHTMLFSATMPSEIADLASRYLRDPIRVEVERPGTTAELVSQELLVVEKADKPEMLRTLLYAHRGTALVFARTRHGARKVAKHVREMGHTAAELHSDRTLSQRKSALEGFKSGQYRVLVATDIAARGIDVKDISVVINFDLPDNPDDYVHRIGRTGRAGSPGRAITIATPEQSKDVRDIEKSIRAQIPLSDDSPLMVAPTNHPAPRPSGRSSGRPSGRSSASSAKPKKTGRAEKPSGPASSPAFGGKTARPAKRLFGSSRRGR